MFPNLRNNFNRTCLFLINKSDIIQNEKEKKNALNALIKNIQIIDNIPEYNFSFFSGKSFIELLENYKKYIYNLERNPANTLYSLYRDWKNNIFYLKSFSDYIDDKIFDQLDEQFNLELDDEIEIEVPENFYNNLKESINNINKNIIIKIKNDEEEDIIKALYKIYYKFKTKDFKDTIYSHSFFDILKNIIIFSNALQIENLKTAFIHFFDNADELFNKKIKTEEEETIEGNKEKCNFIKNKIIPETEKLFIEKEKKINSIIIIGKDKCMDIFDDELKYLDERIKDSNNDIEKASEKLQEKIKQVIEEVNNCQQKEINSIFEEIEKLLNDIINKHYEKKYLEDYEIHINKKKTLEIVKNLFNAAFFKLSTISGLKNFGKEVIRGGLQALGFYTFLGSTFGPIGSVIGFGIGSIICFGVIIRNIFSHSKRYKTNIELCKIDLKQKFDQMQDSLSSDFSFYRDSIISELNIKIEILGKNIDSINKEKWEELRKNYNTQKNNIKKKIQSNINI